MHLASIVETTAGESMDDRQSPMSDPLYAAMVSGGVPYEPWLGLPLKPNMCFLCGCKLDTTNETVEDVYPKWLQRELRAMPDRSRRPLLLPNQTGIALNQVLIPACSECNGVHLSQLEDRVSNAFRAGPSGVRQLSERDLRQWCAKIAYGSRLNDMRLETDRRNVGLSRLATATDMQALTSLHWLLQEVRDAVYVPSGHSSFWIFEASAINCASCDWDVILPIGWPNICMFKHRGSVILGAIDDRGALSRLRDHPAFIVAGSMSLHKLQVRALVAILVAAATSLSSMEYPLRFGVSDGRVWIDRSPSPDVAEPYDEESLANGVLAAFVGVPLKTVEEMGGATGYLILPNGEPRTISISC